jgi:hypothetical protein
MARRLSLLCLLAPSAYSAGWASASSDADQVQWQHYSLLLASLGATRAAVAVLSAARQGPGPHRRRHCGRRVRCDRHPRCACRLRARRAKTRPHGANRCRRRAPGQGRHAAAHRAERSGLGRAGDGGVREGEANGRRGAADGHTVQSVSAVQQREWRDGAMPEVHEAKVARPAPASAVSLPPVPQTPQTPLGRGEGAPPFALEALRAAFRVFDREGRDAVSLEGFKAVLCMKTAAGTAFSESWPPRPPSSSLTPTTLTLRHRL